MNHEGVPSNDPSPHELEKRQLRRDLLDAVRRGDESTLEELRAVYAERHAEDAPLAELVSHVHGYIENHIRASHSRQEESQELRDEIFETLTSFHMEMTAFIADRSEDKEVVEELWSLLAEAVSDPEDREQINRMRTGVLTQVAVQKLFEASGGAPHLSSPEEDFRHAIDLWLDDHTAVQIKGVRGNVNRLITRTETIGFPATVSKNRYVNSSIMHELSRFKFKIEEYARTTERDITGLLVAVPYDQIDHVTGKPSDALVERIKKELEEGNY